MFYLNSTLNFGIPPVLVIQLEVYFKLDRLLTGLTAQPKGTTARWYSNKTSLILITRLCSIFLVKPFMNIMFLFISNHLHHTFISSCFKNFHVTSQNTCNSQFSFIIIAVVVVFSFIKAERIFLS